MQDYRYPFFLANGKRKGNDTEGTFLSFFWGKQYMYNEMDYR